MKESALFDGVPFLMSANKVVGKILIEGVDIRSEGFKERFTFHSHHLFPSVLLYQENKPVAAKIKREVQCQKGMNPLWWGDFSSRLKILKIVYSIKTLIL